MNFYFDKAKEPNIEIFEKLNQLVGLKELSPEERYELAMCFTEIQDSGVAWPMLETLSLSQKELQRIRKMRQKAYFAMRQWYAVRSLADTLIGLGANIEDGRLQIVWSAYSGTLKVIRR